MTERATVTFHTSPEIKARLDRLAAATRRSKSYLANEAVERYLSEEEAFIAAVEEGITQANAGEMISHDEAAAYLRSVAAGRARPEPKSDRA
jgi:predicted transcriptional regulator